MSVWRQRLTIERAVAGQLAAVDEARLRAHLRGCLECRRYYDALTVQARILAGDPHSTRVAAEAEEARLMEALNPIPAVPEVPAWWPRFAVAAAVAAAGIFGFISWRQSSPQPVDQIAWRGSPSPASVSTFAVWVISAPRDGGPLRRDVNFPADSIGQVRTDEWIAFAKKGPVPVEFFKVALVNEQRQTLVLASGQSVALDAGKWRVFAVGLKTSGGAQAFGDEALAAAAREAGVEGKVLKLPTQGDRPVFQVSGTILVQP